MPIWNNLQRFAVVTLCLIAVGCTSSEDLRTQGEQFVGGYTPIDPLPINFNCVHRAENMTDAEYSQAVKDNILQSLPDITMRLAIRQVGGSASLSYGPVKVSEANTAYQVVLDYVQYTTQLVPMNEQESVVQDSDQQQTPSSGTAPRGGTMRTFTLPPNLKSEIEQRNSHDAGGTKTDSSKSSTTATASPPNWSSQSTTSTYVPIYIGVGVRVTANLYTLQGGVDLSSLSSIGAAVSANKASGTLVIQSLGLSGEGVADAIPIPSKIDESTIQSALSAIGTMKAKISNPGVVCIPRVVAIHNIDAKTQGEVEQIILQVLETNNLPPTSKYRLILQTSTCAQQEETVSATPSTEPSGPVPPPANRPSKPTSSPTTVKPTTMQAKPTEPSVPSKISD